MSTGFTIVCLLLQKYGARRWLGRIMVSWGVMCVLMALTRGPLSFYALRFLLGVAEAGFFPGMVLYATYWFPSRYRARIAKHRAALQEVVRGQGWTLTLHRTDRPASEAALRLATLVAARGQG